MLSVKACLLPASQPVQALNIAISIRMIIKTLIKAPGISSASWMPFLKFRKFSQLARCLCHKGDSLNWPLSVLVMGAIDFYCGSGQRA